MTATVSSEVERRWALIVVAFGVFVAADDLMVVATMLRPMINDFELVVPDDLGRAAWIVNVYLVAYIAVMPIAGRLSDVLGRRAVFTGALVIFAAGSIVVPLAPSLSLLFVGRALTAVGGGALVPLAFAVAGDLYSGPARSRALGLLGAIETFGWVWGPLYGAVLVRFLSWRWQFHLNVPLAVLGIVVGWRLLDPTRRDPRRIDWIGALLLTVLLSATGIALLGQARIQSISGLDDLTGGSVGPDWRIAALVALLALVALVLNERRTDGSLIGPLRTGPRSVWAAVTVNVLVGIGLVVAMINVPLFINIVGDSIASSAVRSGWLLTALTAAMAITTYVGGEASARAGNRGPVVLGTVLAAAAMASMGWLWSADTGGAVMAVELAVAGAGIGLVLAPTSAAVVDAASSEQRGIAASLVIMARLIGFSIGLASLTTWTLHRYDQLRSAVELPPLTDPGYAAAATSAAIEVSTAALAETFVGAAAALAAAALVALGLSRQHRDGSG